MQKYILLLLIIVAAGSCKKNTVTAPPPAITDKYSSRAILVELESITLPAVNRYYFMDLGGDNSATKKFFKARLIDIVKDSMEILKGPLPLDSLVLSGFPTHIKSASSGYWLTDFIYSDSVRVRLSGAGSGTGNRIFTASKWVGAGALGANGSVFPISAAVQPWTKGAQIQAYTTIRVPTGTGGFQQKTIFFLFNQKKCVVESIHPNGGGSLPVAGTAEDIPFAIPGSSSYDWENVQNVITYNHAVGADSHLFIDYKNWRYFKIQETNTGPMGAYGMIFHPYKSLDKLLAWPAGWKN